MPKSRLKCHSINKNTGLDSQPKLTSFAISHGWKTPTWQKNLLSCFLALLESRRNLPLTPFGPACPLKYCKDLSCLKSSVTWHSIILSTHSISPTSSASAFRLSRTGGTWESVAVKKVLKIWVKAQKINEPCEKFLFVITFQNKIKDETLAWLYCRYSDKILF